MLKDAILVHSSADILYFQSRYEGYGPRDVIDGSKNSVVKQYFFRLGDTCEESQQDVSASG